MRSITTRPRFQTLFDAFICFYRRAAEVLPVFLRSSVLRPVSVRRRVQSRTLFAVETFTRVD